MPEQRALLSIAVLASVTILSACVVYGVYAHQTSRSSSSQRPIKTAGDATKVETQTTKQVTTDADGKRTTTTTTTTTTSATKKVVSAASKASSDDSGSMDTGSDQGDSDKKETEAEAAATEVSGQEAAVQATKAYKAGDFVEAIELYSLAILQTEKSVPADARNLKVMFSNRAAAFERIGDYQQVVNDCTSALAMDNRHPKAYSRRAKAKVELGDLRGALVDYVCLLVLMEAKQEQLDEKLAMEVTRIHADITAEEVAKANETLSKTPRKLPDAFFITSYYSTFHPSDDENDIVPTETVKAYTAALKESDISDSARGELLIKRALAYRTSHKYDEACADFDAALPLLTPEDPAFYEANIEGGTFCHLKGDFDGARKCFEAALQVKPKAVFPKVRLGGLCFDLKDRESALEWFAKALEDKPTAATAFFHRGQLHSIDQDEATASTSLASAFQDLERCIDVAPDFAMAHIQLGVTHARTGDFEKAIAHLTKATTIRPDLPEVYNYLGETYLQRSQLTQNADDLKKAEDMFDKTMALDASYPMAYINKGTLLMSLGGNGAVDALQLFEKAVQNCPRSKIAFSHLAQVYIAMQEYKRAIEHIDAALALAFAPDELSELLGIRITAETHQRAHNVLQLE